MIELYHSAFSCLIPLTNNFTTLLLPFFTLIVVSCVLCSFAQFAHTNVGSLREQTWRSERAASFQREMPRSCKHEEGLDGNATTSSRIIHKWLFCPARSGPFLRRVFALHVCAAPLLNVVSAKVVTRRLRYYRSPLHFARVYFPHLYFPKYLLKTASMNICIYTHPFASTNYIRIGKRNFASC